MAASIGVQDPHAQVTKMRLVDQANPGDFLVFQYNPSELVSNQSVDWKDKEVAGFSTNPQFSKLGPKRWTFTLFLNDWGRKFDTQRSAEQCIIWLENRMQPRQIGRSDKFEKQPPGLLWISRDVRKVVIESLSVRRKVMRPVPENVPGVRIRAFEEGGLLTDSIEVGSQTFVAGQAVTYTEGLVIERFFGGSVAEFDHDFSINATNLDELRGSRPLDTIRAEVDITLREFFEFSSDATTVGLGEGATT